MKRIPYGIADFDRIIRDKNYYVDKTRYIKELEESDSFVYLCRPRRFGKSIFTNMLRSYYDINKKDKFDELFGDLWIGKNPTELHNQFLVLYFDFSQVIASTDTLEDKFNNYVLNQVDLFLKTYPGCFTDEEKEFVLNCDKNGQQRLINILSICHLPKYNYKLYLMVDEYDNFTNMILSSDPDSLYKTITHGEGFFRSLFKVFKPNFERIYMTGVSPITFDDLTSGYNIATDLSRNSRWNGAIGFTEEEVREMVRYYIEQGVIDKSVDEIIDLIKPWYDNYCFCNSKYGTESVFNANSTLYFLKEYIGNGCAPEEMLDKNTRTDHSKLRQLVNQGDAQDIVTRKEILSQLIEDKKIKFKLPSSFTSEDVTDTENFLAMLFYFGVITYGGYERGRDVLKISNKTMETQYLDYMMASIKSLNIDVRRYVLEDMMELAALDGDWKPLIQYVGDLWHESSSIRNSMRRERDFQAFFHGLVCLNMYYNVRPEMEMNHGYSDLFLFPEPAARVRPIISYIIELKYIKEAEFKEPNDGEQSVLEKNISDAKKQLLQYAQDGTVKSLCGSTQLKLVYVVVKGSDLAEMGEVSV